MQFRAFEEGIEVSGYAVMSVVEGMGVFRETALRILEDHGIRNPVTDEWYKQQSWLNAFEQIAENIGDATLYSIGMKIPENASWPDNIDSIEAALYSIDIAYHMNHRKNGKVMYNSVTGQMTEGIGHYEYEKVSEMEAHVICANPYPCEFDRGIINATVKRFAGINTCTMLNEDNRTCRKKGDNVCKYTIKW